MVNQVGLKVQDDTLEYPERLLKMNLAALPIQLIRYDTVYKETK